MIPDLSEDIVRVELEIPQLQTEVSLALNLDETVWNLKNNVIKTIASSLEESLNFGFYIPSSALKAAKYLDEDRTLREYNLSHGSQLQLIAKKKIYKAAILDTKQLKDINRKVSRKKLIGYIEHDSVKKVRVILNKGLDPNFIDPDLGECPLTLSVALKLPREIISHLVEAGAHLDYRNKQGLTAMHQAARNGYLEAIKILLDFGASPNYRDLDGLTPLYNAVCHDTHPDCIKQLLKDYALLGIRDGEGNSEIHQVCQFGKVQHLELLITYGADMNCTNISGNTPLHICAMKNQEDCARLLLFRGADKHMKNNLNQEAKDLASFYKHYRLMEVISSHTSHDVVLSNELPIYNEKSRLTLKRSDRNSLLLSKMNKLSMSTPYLHQSVSNINWDCTKKSNDSSSIKSNNSENNSTGSADQPFEFDADTVSSQQDSRPNSLSNCANSQTFDKTLRDKYAPTKLQPVNQTATNKMNILFKRLSSAEVIDPPSQKPLRRQSYGNILNSAEESVYMNGIELDNRLNETKVLKCDDTRRMSVDTYKTKEKELNKVKLEKPPNAVGDQASPLPTLDEANYFPVQQEVYLNATQTLKNCRDLTPTFHTINHPSHPRIPYFTKPGKRSSNDYLATLPPNVRQVSITSTHNPINLSQTKDSTENKTFSGHKMHEARTSKPSAASTAYKLQTTSPIKGPVFSFIPPPPVFPNTFKATSSHLSKCNSASVSPPLPPPPTDFSSDPCTSNCPLPPPPQHNRITIPSNPKSELLAAIMKRRYEMETT